MKSLLVIALTLALSAPISAADAKGTPEDEAAIRSLLQGYQTAFNRRDVKAVLMLHTENAELVQRSGICLKGRGELEQQYTRIFKGIFADRPPGAGPRSVSIRFLRPDVAIVHGIGDTTLPGAAGPTTWLPTS